MKASPGCPISNGNCHDLTGGRGHIFKRETQVYSQNLQGQKEQEIRRVAKRSVSHLTKTFHAVKLTFAAPTSELFTPQLIEIEDRHLVSCLSQQQKSLSIFPL